MKTVQFFQNENGWSFAFNDCPAMGEGPFPTASECAEAFIKFLAAWDDVQG